MPRIVLFGATGYTGRLTAEALARRGARPLLAGRSEDRLREVAGALGGLDHAVADVGRPESVRDLLERGDVIVSTVGPFARWGVPAVEAAIARGAHYLDSTGEPAFIRRVFEGWDGGAKAAGVALLTAMGYDWVPGNLAGALALEEGGDAATAVHVGYFMRGGGDPRRAMSGGTLASMAGVMVAPGFARRGGLVRTEPAARRTRRLRAAGQERPGFSVGASEHFGLPQVRPGLRDVDVYLGWFGPLTEGMRVASALTTASGRVPGVTGALGRLADRVPGSSGGPDADQRSRSGSLVVAEALDAAGTPLAHVELTGPNGYDYTAAMLAWGAERALAGAVRGTGALGPVTAFGLRELEGGNREIGLTRA